MLNCHTVSGRLTAAPELRYIKNTPCTRFTIAVDRDYAKADQPREADFLDCIAWRERAEFICNNFVKGQQITLVGSIQTRPYTDSQNNKRKAVEHVVEHAYFCGSKAVGASAAPLESTPTSDGKGA